MADVFYQLRQSRSAVGIEARSDAGAEGWKVWWDTSLTIGDEFRNEIGYWRQRQKIA